MVNYDCIVIGGGITGSALSYELARQGVKVLLLEKDSTPKNATLYSYGGLAYWSGTTPLTRQLCQEGIDIQRHLSTELEANTEFREIDLLLTIDREDEPQKVYQNYCKFAIPPQLLSLEEACQIEPLLSPKHLSGVLKLPHGHIHPQKTNDAYQRAFMRLGGEIKLEPVTGFLEDKKRILGVTTSNQNYQADKTIVCAGGLTRYLLREAGIKIDLYFTHAKLIETPPLEIRLQSLVMPAKQQRSILEDIACKNEIGISWEDLTPHLIGGVLDAGAVQFLDGRFYLGQISELRTDPHAIIDPVASEADIRREVGKVLPSLEKVPGICHHCLVAFADSSHPLVGEIEDFSGVYVFSGFTSPLVIVPPLARHFTRWLIGEDNPIITQLIGNRDCDFKD